MASKMSSEETAGDSSSLCTVCYCAEVEDVFVKMPCCFVKDSTIHYCRSCLKKICSIAENGIGRCPTCQTKYIFDPATEEITLTVPKIISHCGMCCQQKEIEQDNLCSACLIGQSHMYLYECDRCKESQSIPHPMWRYQRKPDEYGSASWACHQRCGDYTHWKILESDLKKIPLHECPESWGLRETWLSEIGQLVRSERKAK